MVEFVKTQWEIPRIGSYYVPEVPPGRSDPGPALDGDAARRLWEETLGRHQELVERRRSLLRVGMEALPEKVSPSLLRRLLTLEIKCIEAALDLLHRIVAPGERVCGHACPHLASGVSPEQAGRYLHSLRDAIDRLEGQLRRSRSSRHLLDYEAEIAAYLRLIRDFLARAEGNSTPT